VQAGLAFGGKLKKDSTFYFFSFETTGAGDWFSTIGANNFGLVPLTNAASFGLPRDRWLLQHRPLSWLGLRLRETHYSPCLPATRSLLRRIGRGIAGNPGALTALGFFPTSGIASARIIS